MDDMVTMNFQITGKVIQGCRIGRRIGFPTANLAVERTFSLRNGVYAVSASVEGMAFRGMANLGYKPTVGGEERLLEVSLFDFDGDLYDRMMEVSLLKWIRDEQKFESVEVLRQQIERDRTQIETYFTQLKNT